MLWRETVTSLFLFSSIPFHIVQLINKGEATYINNNVNKPKNAATNLCSEYKGTILRKRCQGLNLVFRIVT